MIEGLKNLFGRAKRERIKKYEKAYRQMSLDARDTHDNLLKKAALTPHFFRNDYLVEQLTAISNVLNSEFEGKKNA